MKELVVISGKGGTGKTTVTAGLSSLGPKKVLADCDVDAADLHLILKPTVRATHEFFSGELASIDSSLCVECGQCIEHCRYDAITPDFVVHKEHCEGCGACEFVCPSGAAIMQERMCGHWYDSETRFGSMIHAALGIGEENSGKLVTTVRKEARRVAEDADVDLILTDGPPGVGCPVIASLGGTDMALAVAEPTLSAMHDLQRVHKLTEHFRVPMMAVINKSDINEEITEMIRQWCAESGVEIAGVLPYDQTVTAAQIHGKSVVEYDPDGFGQKMQSIWENVSKRLCD
ncbi:ATP-binding protein [Desulfobaculum bizertense]|uniref:MinD superfamily P-loop ATPase, contains an inserted ferredoxin domain n=1 Tax=Desulfobaculum bizertense DSM 18034 TaxID=1121442 RepID=A0A1T4VTX2_9BACT|nr:ATP-binding protein [Desulfobaculum bizertense]UIJ38461.1 ATP-binding protein [Desulfobaculum bizertense]SKA68295.1 MinD superfamily P-loop ATPase, contains an inserted ferredoxin domain [Desulfobaculum bizertense DSM 18034]